MSLSYIHCKICGSATKKLFKAKVMHKYDIQYFKCKNCHFIQTEKEYWLKEAYNESMNISDTGVVMRNIILGIRTSLLLTLLLDRRASFIDYGGGWGIYTRLIRDIGLNFFWYDPYTSNEIARGFEAELNKKYEALTIFEGFEHFEEPLKEIEKMFKLSDTIIFSTSLVPKPIPLAGEWHYYGFEHGQHIAFYSKATFEYIADRYRCNYYTDNKYLHILTKRKFPRYKIHLLLSIFSIVLFPFVIFLNKSKTVSDSKFLSERHNIE